MDAKFSKKSKSDAVRWNENGPTVPLVVLIVFFIVTGLAIGLIAFKLLRKYWDKKRKSDSYAFVDNSEEERAVLKKAKDEEEEEGLKLNSIEIKKQDVTENSTELKDNVNNWPDQSTFLAEFENEAESKLSQTETLPLTKKNFKATESDV